MHPGAGRFSRSGRDAVSIAGLKIEEIDLIKGIALLAFALKDELAAIGGEIPLSGPDALEGKLARGAEELCLKGGIRDLLRGGEGENKQRGGNPTGYGR